MKMRHSRFLGLMFVCLLVLSCNFPLTQPESSKDQPSVKSPVLALAINLDGQSPRFHLFVGHSTEDSWLLPAGDFYIEAAGEDHLVYPIGRLTIPQPGGNVELGKRMTIVGGISAPQHHQELILIANALTGIKSGMLSFLEHSSNSFSTPLFDPQYAWTPADIRAVRENYDPVLAREEETLQALMALELRMGETLGFNSCPGMCKPNKGILDSMLSFFVSMNVVDQHAVEDILAGSAAMSVEEKADAFEYFPSSLTGGAQSFDEMLRNLQSGRLDKYAPTRIRNLLMDEPTFVEALTDVRKTNRPLLHIAHEEGSVLVQKGAEMQVEIIKQVLQVAFPGIETGFNYADKVNEWAEFIRSTYEDPLQGVADFAAGQAASQISGQIKSGLLDMGYGDELAAEMADYLSEEIIGQITKLDPELEALMAEAEEKETHRLEEDQSQESDLQNFAGCLAESSQYTWGIEGNERHDCLDPQRCTGCIGTFFVQNNSNQVLFFTHYYYDSYLIPVAEGWKPGLLTLQPGERFERKVSLRNEWRKGETYVSQITRILLVRDDPACFPISQAFMETHAITVDQISCE